MIWSKWSFALVWSRWRGLEGRGGGGSERDWGEKRKIRVKNTIETDKEKIKKEKKDSFPV